MPYFELVSKSKKLQKALKIQLQIIANMILVCFENKKGSNMGRLILTGTELESTIELNDIDAHLTVAPGAFINATSIVNANGNTRLGGITNIDIQNDSILTVTDNRAPLEDLTVSSGSLTLYNNYVGTTQTNIQIGDNSQIILTATDFPTGTIILGANALFNFTRNGTNYHFQTSTESVIQDLDLLVNLSEFLNNHFASPAPYHIDYNKVAGLRAYQNIDKDLLNLFMQQNDMLVNQYNIDYFIAENYWELAGITHNIDNIPCQLALPDILGKICLYASLSDIQ